MRKGNKIHGAYVARGEKTRKKEKDNGVTEGGGRRRKVNKGIIGREKDNEGIGVRKKRRNNEINEGLGGGRRKRR